VHKGYSTPLHLEALRTRIPSPLHRRSFSPVRIALETLTGATLSEIALIQVSGAEGLTAAIDEN
jgi:ribonuclease HII